MENVWDYPRPPALQQTPQRLRVLWKADGASEWPLTIADTTNAYRVLETSHPPTYYIPPEDVNTSLLTQSSARQTFCEWKGKATYWDFKSPTTDDTVQSQIWTYQAPTEDFKAIKGYYSFYASPWTCMVNEEIVDPQAGQFYGGWKTSNITGGSKGMKGGPGTFGW